MARPAQLSLWVFIDAFGWELARRIPFLNEVLITKAPLGTLFGYSSTCDPTILTGKLPREHGHFAFYYYNPSASPFRWYRALNLLPEFATSRGRVRHKMSQILARLHGYTGYFELYNMPFGQLHLFDYSEKRDIYAPGGINSGAPTIFDVLRQEKIPFSLSNWHVPEEARWAALRADIQRGEVGFAFLFIGELDAVLHYHGTRSPKAVEHLRGYEERLRGILDEARRRYDAVRLFVFSDHGMTDTRKTCDLMARIDALGLRFGVDYAAAYDSTMARFWFLSAGARTAILSALSEEPDGRVLSDATLAEWGCNFPDRRYGEVFFLLNPGVLLCPSFMGKKPMAAMHGYDPLHPDSVAAFLSSEAIAALPNRLEDLFGLMRAEAEATRA